MNKFLKIFILIFCLSFVLIASYNFYLFKKTDNLVRQAAIEDKNGNYSKALSFCTAAIHINKSYMPAYLICGNARLALKDYNGSLKDFKKAIELNHNVDYGYLGKANAEIPLKMYKEAYDDLTTAIKVKQNNPISYLQRGNLQNLLENYKEALKDLNKVIELDNTMIIAFEGRASVKTSLKDYNGVIKDYLTVLKSEPNNADAILMLALIKEKQGKKQEALDLLKKSLYLYKKAGDPEKVSDIKKYIKEIE